MKKNKLLIADDHKIVRDGIRALLEDEPRFEVTAEAKNGREAMDICSKQEIDVVIMDINMPEMNGLETIEKIRSVQPGIKILMLSMLSKHDVIKKALESGVDGYILKNSSSEELVDALEIIMDGEKYFTEEVTKTIMEGFKEGPDGREVSLNEVTSREKDILKLICKELTNNEIAESLDISVRTVDSHRRNLLQKIGAKNTAGLVKFAIRNGLTDE